MIEAGRLTTSFKISGTGTFRLASAKLLSTIGTNLQNPTASLMRCVIPEDNHVFIQPDQSGAEALIVAMECRPGKFRRLFELDLKVHSYMALQLYPDLFRGSFPSSRYTAIEPDNLIKLPEVKELFKTIKNSPTPYYIGKKTIHSFNYDEGIHLFRLVVLEESEGQIVLTYKQAKEFKGIWAATFPEIVEGQAETIAKLKRDGTLRNLFGYPRIFSELWNDAVARKGLAFVPQSTVATISNIAYTELFHRIKKEHLPWRLMNNKHDSLLIEAPDTTEHREQAIAYSRQHLGRELTSSRGETYTMKVGISVGHNWAAYSPTNPTGMKEI